MEVFDDADAVAREAAKFIAAEACTAVAAQGRFVMAVSGGHTPWQMLRALANEALPWESVHVVQVDERIAPAGRIRQEQALVMADRATRHEAVDFGAHTLNPNNDYPDSVIPLARAVVAGMVDRGLAICGSGVSASVCANKFRGFAREL